MSQFRIKGIDYVDDSLQHGLGKGSGRGRPVGSKNGQIMPGAAYMKDYKIVGQKAVGEPATPGNTNPQNRTLKTIGTTAPRANSRANATGTQSARKAGSTANRQTTTATRQASTPASTVARGKSAVESIISKGSTSTASTASTNAQTSNTQKQINDSPYSERRIREAGGLESRAGRQIVYDNPGLNESYKKQLAKRYGDSDGRHVPKSVDETREDWPEIKDSPYSERRIREAGGLQSREGRQIVYSNPYLNEDYKKQIAKRYGDSDGRSYPKEMDQTARTNNAEQQTNTSAQNNENSGTQTSEALSKALLRDYRSVADNQPVNPLMPAMPNQAGAALQRDVRSGMNQPAVNPAAQTAANQAANRPAAEQHQTAPQAQASAQEAPQAQASAQEAPAQNDIWSQLGNAANAAGQWIGNAANDVGQWVGNAANDVGRAVTNLVSGGNAEANNPQQNAPAEQADEWGPMNEGTVRPSANVNPRTDTAEAEPAAQETPEQKSFWDNVGGWFAQAGKDIGDTAVGAWNTVSGAAGDAAKWVGDRLGEAGDWAQTAYSDVSDWVGNRAADLGNAIGAAANGVGRFLNETWNGRDVEVNDKGRFRQGHEAGLRENLGNALNSAGQWIGNAANDAGRWIGNAANDTGRFLNETWNGRDVEVNDNGRFRQGHEAGLRENLGNALNSAGQWVGNAANDVSQFAGNAVNNLGNAVASGARAADYWWNGTPYSELDPDTVNFRPGDPNANPRIGGARAAITSALGNAGANIANAANDAGRWIGNAANDTGRFLNETWNGRDVEVNDNGRWRQGHEAGLRENVGNAFNSAGRNISNFVNGPQPGTPEAAPYYDVISGRWVDPMSQTLGDRIGQLAENNIAIPAAQAANNAAIAVNNAGQWLNENVVTPATNAVNTAGQWIGDTANSAGAAADEWWNGRDVYTLGIPTGHIPGARENIGTAINNFGQTLGNAGQAANEWWNGTDQSFLGIPTGHTPGARENIGNAINNFGQTVGNAVNDIGTQISVPSVVNSARSSGVPQAALEDLEYQYRSGELTPEEYVESLNRAAEYYRYQNGR